MKDGQALLWIYINSKKHLFRMIILIVGNSAFAMCGVVFALVCRSIIDAVSKGDKRSFILYCLLLLSVIIFQFALRILCQNLSIMIQAKLEMEYKSKLFGDILRKEYTHVSEFHSGELLNRLTGDISIISQGITSVLADTASIATKLIGAFVVLFGFDPVFALAFPVSGFLVFFTTSIFRKKLKDLHKTMQEKDGKVRSFLQEMIENNIVINIFGVENKISNKAAQLQLDHYEAKLKKNRFSIFANSGLSLVFSLGYIYALIWGSIGLFNKTISFGTLTAVLQLVGQVQSPFAGLSGIIPKIYGVYASIERLIEIEDLPEDTKVGEQAIDTTAIYSNMQYIEFDNVSFSYNSATVFNHVKLKIEKGDFAVISGISGIGKSTLLKLLLGVYIPNDGAIFIEINNRKQIPINRSTRKLFSYVPQNNLLLSGTIRDNITFVNSEANEDEIDSALKLSCADQFISELPEGLETLIGENGFGLSEGQIQRIAIARALLTKAPILLLDESTSALDSEVEIKLLKNIKTLTDKTCIFVSHKDSTAEICNKEIRIENATIQSYERKRTIEPCSI